MNLLDRLAERVNAAVEKYEVDKASPADNGISALSRFTDPALDPRNLTEEDTADIVDAGGTEYAPLRDYTIYQASDVQGE